ncbi:TIGR02452 family protein [Nonomuraea longicatena]|uniref:TIGR02452 family protein n=1 Tax=Nonomuraea longicatena TaxID=83682 RepID=A0ABN1P025_9ACTN
MSTRLRQIARDTVTAVERGGYTAPSGRWVPLADEIAQAVAGTRLHLPDEPLQRHRGQPAQDRVEVVGIVGETTLKAEQDRVEVVNETILKAERGRVEVVNETTLEAARALSGGGEVACLVFASAKNPGGGFLNGAQAQEESVARASALYPCLTSVPAFYAFHRAQKDLLYSDRVVYSPRVPVFRDDKGRLLEEPYQVDFLTAAAPNARFVALNQPESAGLLPSVLRERAGRVLDVAEAHGHRRLVLGAWGCGVFGNDPATVADAFACALAVRDRFEYVRFAVLDRAPGTPTHAAFARALTGI